MNRVFKYILRDRIHVSAAVICAVVSSAASLAGPVLIGNAIDSMLGVSKVNFDYLIKILFILGGIYMAGAVFTWLLAYLTNNISYRTANKMRRELFNKLNKLPVKYFDRNAHGDIMSRFINDIDIITDGMIQVISILLTGLCTIAGAVVFMMWINPLMALAVFLSAPASYFTARFITVNSRKMFRKQAKTLGELNGYAEEYITGQKVVQMFSFQDKAYEKFREINNELYKSGVKAQFYGSLANPSSRLINNITYSIIGMAGSISAILGRITVGQISSFLIYSNLFARPFNEITGVLTQIQAASASAERIFKVLDSPEETEEAYSEVMKENVKGSVEFRNVSFFYSPEKPLIENFNLKVQPGSTVAIVGKTGAGKTTLVNLLMRFYEVTSGEIYVDGENIQHVSRDTLRKNFGMVLQDTWLFEGTAADNISYGKPEASHEEVVRAARAADAHNFIMRLPQGYDTVINDSGENLSQGQRQLLTIARVMLSDPPALILDEATSSIDTRTEIKIQKAFLNMMKGRTSFIIAHRLSTIKEADIILFMEDGNVKESGTHKELMEKKGSYFNMYNSQF